MWYKYSTYFSSVTQSCPTLCDPMDCSTPGFPVQLQLLEFTQTHVHWVGYAIQAFCLCHPLLILPSIFPSIRWPKYWSFSFTISPSSEYSGLIFFRIDWFDLAVHRTLLQRSFTGIILYDVNLSFQLSFVWCEPDMFFHSLTDRI